MDYAVFVFVFVGGSRGFGFGNEVVEFTESQIYKFV